MLEPCNMLLFWGVEESRDETLDGERERLFNTVAEITTETKSRIRRNSSDSKSRNSWKFQRLSPETPKYS